MKWEHYKLFRTARYFAGGTILIMLANIALALLSGKEGFLMNVSTIFNFLFGLMLIGGIFLIWVFHFYRSLAGKEAAVTLMLPLSSPRLLFGKMLPGFLQMSAAVIAVNLIWLLQAKIAGYSYLPLLRLFLSVYMDSAKAPDAAVYALFLAYELFFVLTSLLGFASYILLGSGKALSNMGVAGPILVYVINYVVFQVVAFAVMIATGFLSLVMSAKNSGGPELQAADLRNFVILMAVLGFVCTAGLFIGGAYRFVKRPFIR